MSDKIPLANILDQIASELIAADARAKSRGQAVMSFEECEVEFDVAIEHHGEAGLKVYVVNIGAGAKQTDTNKIKIKFKALPGHATQAGQVTEGPAPDIK
ncbi:trypco2 family protein [Methylobacterium sp. D53M]